MSALLPQSDLRAAWHGRVLNGRYQLEHLVATSGSSLLFRARDRVEERVVAIKVVSPRVGRPNSDARGFVIEAAITRGLTHPNIVTAFDAQVTSDGVAYMVMELLSGENLADKLARSGPLSLDETLELLFPIMGAVAYAHDRDVLHRDIKPENIFLARGDQNELIPKLLDFGVAKSLDVTNTTSSGVVIGTPSYMSPEQALAERLTIASDIWSLGVVAFQCLSGRLPFEAESITSLLMKIAEGGAPPLSLFAPGVSKRVDLVIERALRRDPANRYVDVRSFARALHDAALQEGVALPNDPDRVGLSDYRKWQRTTPNETIACELGPPPSPTSRAPRSLEKRAHVEVRYRTTHAVVASVGNVIVSWTGGIIDPEATRAAYEHTAWLCERHPSGIARILIVDHSVSMPSAGERALMTRLTRTYAQQTLAHALVLRGNGLWMTTSRMVARTMLLALKSPIRQEIFENVGRATSWLHQTCDRNAMFETYELETWIAQNCPFRPKSRSYNT